MLKVVSIEMKSNCGKADTLLNAQAVQFQKASIGFQD